MRLCKPSPRVRPFFPGWESNVASAVSGESSPASQRSPQNRKEPRRHSRWLAGLLWLSHPNPARWGRFLALVTHLWAPAPAVAAPSPKGALKASGPSQGQVPRQDLPEVTVWTHGLGTRCRCARRRKGRPEISGHGTCPQPYTRNQTQFQSRGLSVHHTAPFSKLSPVHEVGILEPF